MKKFKIGDGVTVNTGPMKGLYGNVVWYNEKNGEWLVRFTGQQQLFFTEDEIIFWK